MTIGRHDAGDGEEEEEEGKEETPASLPDPHHFTSFILNQITMQGVVVTSKGETQVKTVDIPQPGSGQILIKVSYILLHILSRLTPTDSLVNIEPCSCYQSYRLEGEPTVPVQLLPTIDVISC